MKIGLQYSINTAEKFSAELAKIDGPFIAKFDGGGSGVMNMVFVPEEGRFGSGDKFVDARWIWRQYQSVMSVGFLVEERVVNHPVLAEIHATSLNTLRLNTVKLADGQWHILRLCLKFRRGGSHVDNTSAGGLFAAVDERGRRGMTYAAGGQFYVP